MNLVNPRGEPLTPSLSDMQLKTLLSQILQTLQHQGTDLFVVGTYIDWMREKLSTLTDAEGNPLLVLDPKEFEVYLQEHARQIEAQRSPIAIPEIR